MSELKPYITYKTEPKKQPTDSWISVEDRLPENSTEVLTCENGMVMIDIYHGSHPAAETPWDSWNEPTHWMPLPEPPSNGE